MADSSKVKDLYDAYREDILKAFSDGHTVCHGLAAGEFQRRDKECRISVPDYICTFTPCDTGVKAVYKDVEYFFDTA